MRLRCLIVDTDVEFTGRIQSLLDAVPSLSVETVSNVHDAAQNINSQSPNLVIARRDLLGDEFGRVIHALSRINIRCYVIIVVQSLTADHNNEC